MMTLSDRSLEAGFSLVRGGPFHGLLRRARGGSESPRAAVLTAATLAAVSWTPIVLLSLAAGTAYGAGVRVPFLMDLPAHVRLLAGIPLLLLAELVVDGRLAPIVAHLADSGLLPAHAREAYRRELAAVARRRDSIVAEAFLLVLVVTLVVGSVTWSGAARPAEGANTWFSSWENGQERISSAGWWYLLVGAPLFQFLLLRWIWRLWIWARFLWALSRLDLLVIPSHPDQAGGLAVLAETQMAFISVLLAPAAAFSASLARMILQEGHTLAQCKVAIGTFMIVGAGVILGPLLAFTGRLAAARRRGLLEYGSTAQALSNRFRHGWMEKEIRSGPEGAPGIEIVSAVADFGGVFEAVRKMRVVPFEARQAAQVVVVLAVPFLPLALMELSVKEILKRVATILL